ncbi:MAG: PEP/pyruvate-binding domain-containing protein, partial [Myxococcota bacterium]
IFQGEAALARLDFMAWPEGASLGRRDDGPMQYCRGGSGLEGPCDVLPSRAVADRLRYLRTPGDFAALAAGGTTLGLSAVKFIVDLEREGAVHLLSASDYDLHYTFVRERIEEAEHLDRCDPDEALVFRRAWGQYSAENYSRVEGRRFLGGTLVSHAGAGVQTVEFVTGDNISSSQMHFAFFEVTSHVFEPRSWHIRPQGNQQRLKVTELEGSAPILGEDAIRAGVRFQPLNAAVSYGVLRFVPATELSSRTDLGSEVILLTDDVPNDLPLVGGVITEGLQTPLAHVNVLSRGRGTPNMALRDARSDARVAALLDTLVRFEVTEGGFSLAAAGADEAEQFWQAQRPDGPPVAPRLDESFDGLVDLTTVGLSAVPAIGAKAAQLAELGRVVSRRSACAGPIPMPDRPFAVPVRHYLRHFDASGAQTILDAAENDPAFRTDSRRRAEVLEEVRTAIQTHPVDSALLQLLESTLRDRWGRQRVRFRSSSNVEDLPDFSGAGLYTSTSVELDDPERTLDDGLRTVWSSLWNARAYEERRRGHIDQNAVAMGVLVHPAFRSEIANGIGVSRNVLDLTRNDIYYFNVQAGEASVANPAPGISTDAYQYRWGRSPRVVYESRSSLTPFDVLRVQEIDRAACLVHAIHDHFEPLIDPQSERPFFAMDIEWKVVGDDRRVIVKQARPYDVGTAEAPADCRGF